jgi:AraC-like DNA-binding protein
MQTMTCSGRFVRAFIKVVRQYPQFARSVSRIGALPPDRRVDVAIAYDTATRWVVATGDANLGLRAALTMQLGTGGPLDYALHSARCLRDSLAVAMRYSMLYSDALEIDWTQESELVIIRFGARVTQPRAATDFLLGTWFRTHLQIQLEDPSEARAGVWFTYDRPEDLTMHQRVFGAAELHFGAPFNGFSFSREYLDRPLATAAPLLHAVHCEFLESLGFGPSKTRTTSERVRNLIAGELRRGRPSATRVARALGMSRRTLVRRLEREQTTYQSELDALRRELAFRFVPKPELSSHEVASLLGFTHVQGFHRAFKRWTGMTPLQYRGSQPGGVESIGPDPEA